MPSRERDVSNDVIKYEALDTIEDMKALEQELKNTFPAIPEKDLILEIYDNTNGLTDFSRYVFGLEPVGNYGSGNYQVFYENGSFTAPVSGTYRVKVVGGGSGGTLYIGGAGGKGGAGGGYAMKEVELVAGTITPITVAARAAWNTAGNSSSFGNLVSATGGNSGAGGSGVGGDENYNGGNTNSGGGAAPACELGNALTNTGACGAGLRSIGGNISSSDTSFSTGGGIRFLHQSQGGTLLGIHNNSILYGLLTAENNIYRYYPVLTSGLPFEKVRPFLAARIGQEECGQFDDRLTDNGAYAMRYKITFRDGSSYIIKRPYYPYGKPEIYGWRFGCGIGSGYSNKNPYTCYTSFRVVSNYGRGIKVKDNCYVSGYQIPFQYYTEGLEFPTYSGWGGGGGAIYNQTITPPVPDEIWSRGEYTNGNYGGGGACYYGGTFISTWTCAGNGGVGGGGASFTFSASYSPNAIFGNGGIGAGGGGWRDNVSTGISLPTTCGRGGGGIVIVEW